MNLEGNDIHDDFLHLKFLVDALAQIVTEFWHFLTSWPSYLTFDLEIEWVSSHYRDAYLYEVWWWLAKRFKLNLANNIHPDKQTDIQTVRRTYLPKVKIVASKQPSDVHTCHNVLFCKVSLKAIKCWSLVILAVFKINMLKDYYLIYPADNSVSNMTCGWWGRFHHHQILLFAYYSKLSCGAARATQDWLP